MPKVLLTQPFPPATVARLRALLPPNVELDMVPNLEQTEFAAHAQNADVLLTAYRRVDASLLALAPQVRFIQQLGVGYNNIDVAAVAAAGILASHTPGVNSEAVAEHTIMLMLALLKRFTQAEQSARAGQWAYQAMMEMGLGDLSGATVGLIGLGAIGKATAERLRPFGSRLLYTSRRRVEAETEARLELTYLSLPELLAASNIVSLHLPLTEETRHLIGEQTLGQMQRGAFLVNTARGGLVDEAALRSAIESGQLGGAALDVVEHETEGGNPFTDLPQVLVTPHVAGISRAAASRMMQTALANLGRFLSGQTPLYPIPGTTQADR